MLLSYGCGFRLAGLDRRFEKELLLEHGIPVGSFLRDFLQDIPVLHDPGILNPENVHDCHSPVFRCSDKVTVDSDKISLCNEPFELEPEPGKYLAETADKRDECICPVPRTRIVLPVARAQILFSSLFRPPEIQCQIVEILHDLPVFLQFFFHGSSPVSSIPVPAHKIADRYTIVMTG